MAIAVDAVSNSGNSILYGKSSCSWSHTCTGANRVLVVCLQTFISAVTSVKYNGVAMTEAKSQGSAFGYYSRIYYLVNPATGANLIAVVMTGNTYGAGEAISFTGADTDSPLGANESATNTGTAVSTSITTTAANSFIVDCLKSDGSDVGNPTVGAGQTTIAIIAKPSNFNSQAASYKAKSTAGATTMTWTLSTSAQWAHVAVEILGESITDYPESCSVIIGVKPVADRDFDADRASAVIVGVLASASRVWGCAIASSVIVGVVASASRVLGYVKASSVVVGIVTSVSYIIAIGRASAVVVGIVTTASKSWAKSITSLVIVGIVTTASRLFGRKQTSAVVIGISVLAAKSLDRTRTSKVIIGISVLVHFPGRMLIPALYFHHKFITTLKVSHKFITTLTIHHRFVTTLWTYHKFITKLVTHHKFINKLFLR